jgi:hypothetical protein
MLSQRFPATGRNGLRQHGARPIYTLATAAAAAGINRSTVFRAIKAGRISAQRDDNGQWQIDPAEFHRVFSPLPTPATSSQPTMQHGAMTDALVTTLNKVIDDLRADRDHWQSQSDHWRAAYENTQRLIPSLMQQRAITESTPATTPAPLKLVRRRVRWWGWHRRSV